LQRIFRLQSDLIVIFVWTIFTIVLMITPSLNETVIRKILITPVLLFIPGYVLIAAIFPSKYDIELIERLALSSGISIAIAPLLGLLLKFTLQIGLLELLLALCLLTIILIIFAAYRRGKLDSEKRFYVPFYRIQEIITEELNIPESKIDFISTSILIFFIVLAIGMMYFVITTPKIGEKFTEFYILGHEGKADNYPSVLQYNYPTNILVGVVNHEYVSANYTVRIALDNEILTDRLFFLNHNETWENNVTFVPDKYGTDMKLDFWLFKEDNFTAPYRELYIWVTVEK
jgi:uncharacterized membrane protein